MISIASKLIRAEWKPSLFFVSLILSLSCLSVFVFTSKLIVIVLFFIGLDIYNGYFIYMGKALKGEKLKNPYAFILVGKDKNRYDFIILLVFFASILLLLKGPMILFQALFAQKLHEFLISIGGWYILYQSFILFCYSAYFVALYSAISSMTYHKYEVLESFKVGIKGVWKFKFILLILFVSQIGNVVIIYATKNGTIHALLRLYFNILPAVVMFLMSCSYSLADTQLLEKSAMAQPLAAPDASPPIRRA